jgi:hypothetical protein
MSSAPDFYKKSYLVQNFFLRKVKSNNKALYLDLKEKIIIINSLEKLVTKYKISKNPFILFNLFFSLNKKSNNKIVFRWLLIKVEKKIFSLYHKVKNFNVVLDK